MSHRFNATNFPILKLLSGFYFFYYAILGIFIPYWTLYLEHEGFNKSQIGWLVAITMFSRVFAPYCWGIIADKTGQSVLYIRLAVFVEACVWLSLLFVDRHFITFVVLMFVYSFFQNATVPLTETVSLSWIKSKQGDYGKIRRWASIGFLCMVLLLGFLFDVISIAYVPYFLIGLSALCVFTSLVIRQNNDVHQKQKTNSDGFYTKLTKKPIIWFYLAQTVLLLSHAPFYGFYSNYLADFGYSTGKIGLLWTVALVAEIAMFSQSKSILSRYGFHGLMALCLFLTGVRWLLVAYFPTLLWVQLLAQTLHAFSFGLFQTLAMHFIFNNFAVNEQSRAQALYMSCWGLGVALGSVLVGHYWLITGGSFWFMMAGCMVILFSIVLYWLNPFNMFLTNKK